MGKEQRPATVIGALLVIAGSGLAVPETRAATYEVRECTAAHGGIGAPDAQGFARNMGPDLVDYCAPTPLNYLGLHATGQAEPVPPFVNGANGWRFTAPPGTDFVAVATTASGNNSSGVFPEIVNSTGHQWTNTGAAMPGNPTQFFWSGEGGGPVNWVEFRVRCVTDNTGCNPSEPAYITAGDIDFKLSDAVTPSIGPVGGPLLDTSRSQRGTVGVEIGGSDVGSGVYQAIVHANDSRVNTAGYGCDVTSEGYGRRLVPCPGAPKQTVPVNTAGPAFHTGVNRLTLCVADLAGQTACEGAEARVDNACPDAGPAVAKLRRVRFKGGGAGKKATATTRFGRTVRLRGRVIDAAGNPVVGATICLGHHIAGDRYAVEEVNSTRSGRTGRFRFELERGPSKDYRVAVWQGASALEEFRTLLVKAKPKLRIKGTARPGRRIRLRVKINQPRIAGKVVKLQAKSNAGWVGVPRCTGQTAAGGWYGCRTRVPKGTAGAKLVYRAVVPREAGYPYLRGHSRVKSKRVRG